jgi:hypothetical protein
MRRTYLFLTILFVAVMILLTLAGNRKACAGSSGGAFAFSICSEIRLRKVTRSRTTSGRGHGKLLYRD